MTLLTHDDFAIEAEQPKVLTLSEDIGVLRHALARHPTSARVRRRLGICLFLNDESDAAIPLLASVAEENDDPLSWTMLASANLSLNTSAGDQAAVESAGRAAAVAGDPDERAEALAVMGKAQLRLGHEDAAIASWRAALAAAPDNKDAYKRLATLYLSRDRPGQVLALADEFFGDALGHSRLLVSRVVSLLRLGRVDDARVAGGLEPFLHRKVLPPPPGWSDIAAFNRDLVDELDRHPSIRFNRYGVASQETWRIDNPLTARSDMMKALQPLILDEVRRYVARLDGVDHPWLAARPDNAVLHSWCVMTTVEGYETWHVHQFGWLSGVYYVAVPEAVRAGDGVGGCITFGMPAEQVGAEQAAAYGEIMVRPETGLLMLFPSHSYHRTFPHGGQERRICIAFDIKAE